MNTLSLGSQNKVFASVAVLVTLLAAQFAAFALPQLTSLHRFNGADGALYGSTSHGGSASLGTVFRLGCPTLGLTTLNGIVDSDGPRL